MSAAKIRVGIVGIGFFASAIHIPKLRESGEAEVVAVCRRNTEKLAILKGVFDIPETYTDWREMLAKSSLDAVVIATPHYLHAEPTIESLAHGLHVLVEKPIALSYTDAIAMANAGDKAGKVLMVGYSRRFSGIWRTVKHQILDGVIGTIRQINMAVNYYRQWIWDSDTMPADVREVGANMNQALGLPADFGADWGHDWHQNTEEAGGGAFVSNGTHTLDLALWLAGAPPLEVVAFTENAGLPVECFVNLQARLSNGVLLSVSSADAVPQSIMNENRSVMIVGDAGIIYDDVDGSLWMYRNEKRQKIESELPDLSAAEGFVSAIRGSGPNLAPANESAWAVALTEASYRSAKEKRIIKLG